MIPTSPMLAIVKSVVFEVHSSSLPPDPTPSLKRFDPLTRTSPSWTPLAPSRSLGLPAPRSPKPSRSPAPYCLAYRRNTGSPATRSSATQSSRASVNSAPSVASGDGLFASTASSVPPAGARTSTKSALRPA
jgi:hypothetical protein